MSEEPKYKLGTHVVLNKKREGIIRYVGSVTGHRGTFYGIELTKGDGNTDGLYQSERYFTCSSDKGKFVPERSIVRAKKGKKRSVSSPPKKKRKITSSSTSDHDDNQENNTKSTDDEFQIVSSNSRKRKRTQRTYRRHIVSSSKSVRIKPQTYQKDPFETNEDDSLSNAESHDKNESDYDMENHEENTENMDDDTNGYMMEIESINTDIDGFTVHKLKHYLKNLQNLANDDEEQIFTNCSLKGKKKDLIKRIKEKILLIYTKNIKDTSNQRYSNQMFEAWKINIKQFIADAKTLKSPKKNTDKAIMYTNKHLDDDDDDDDDGDEASDISRSSHRRSTRLQIKQKPNYADSVGSQRKENDDEDTGASVDTLNVDICLNANKTTTNDIMGINLDEVEDENDTNDHGIIQKTDNDQCSMDTTKSDSVMSIDTILGGLQKLKQRNEIEMNKKEMELKENEKKVSTMKQEMSDLKEKYKRDSGVKNEKISKLAEKNKKRKQEIFVLKRKNEIQQKAIEEKEEMIEEKDNMIQEKDEENKKLKKSQKDNKQMITKQQNEMVELKIYKELYDNDQDMTLTQNDSN